MLTMVPNRLIAINLQYNSQLRPYIKDLKFFKTDNGKFAQIFQEEYEREVRSWESTLHFLE
jgi:hypothetical protein